MEKTTHFGYKDVDVDNDNYYDDDYDDEDDGDDAESGNRDCECRS